MGIWCFSSWALQNPAGLLQHPSRTRCSPQFPARTQAAFASQPTWFQFAACEAAGGMGLQSAGSAAFPGLPAAQLGWQSRSSSKPTHPFWSHQCSLPRFPPGERCGLSPRCALPAPTQHSAVWDGGFIGAGCRNRDFSHAALFHGCTYSSTRACWVRPSPAIPQHSVAVGISKAPGLAMGLSPSPRALLHSILLLGQGWGPR